MIRVGITGQAGFVGTHLFNHLNLELSVFQTVPFEDAYFGDIGKLKSWVSSCDVIVHLAALNRHNDPGVIYKTNLRLVNELINSLEETGSTPHILFSSSTQEEFDHPYGRSKREGRELLYGWAKKTGAKFTGLVIPNVFGPFGNPYYNSVVATFSHQLNHGEETRIEVDKELTLIYVDELIDVIKDCILNQTNDAEHAVKHSYQLKVTELLEILQNFYESYVVYGIVPLLSNRFERNLFNTFRSYMDIPNHFPVVLKEHEDERGSFVETMKLEVGGQVSFSTTKPGITRGNHFHTRKIERFVVIRGKALIQLRKIGTGEVLEFTLDGEAPSYVDMPIWYTHNIKNTGDTELYTIFWINEFYNPGDPDTYYEDV